MAKKAPSKTSVKNRRPAPRVVQEHLAMLQLLENVGTKLEDLTSSIGGLDKRIDLHIQKCEYEFQEIRRLDEQQNEILTEHHDRSTQLKKDNELREEALRKEIIAVSGRVAVLETPLTWLKGSWKVLFYCSLVAGAIYGIHEFITIFKS